ncbi:hypothetical protein SISNIDRAFT_498184 [Sistotremastrum niveocremeum HHB9708]|uniref:Uncharacterized protein n=1 Tax=Sistotremastrum niveocremeum HHB9708 TaxID=1314777 RepID=A0A164NU04_9AGAM|nr:hypothetical protein SISNIDRAFT_498184 [Sistotremastrum niveocremeum HHB9708]
MGLLVENVSPESQDYNFKNTVPYSFDQHIARMAGITLKTNFHMKFDLAISGYRIDMGPLNDAGFQDFYSESDLDLDASRDARDYRCSRGLFVVEMDMLQRDVETAKEKSVHESSDVIFYGEQGNPDMDIDRDLNLDLHGDRGIACSKLLFRYLSDPLRNPSIEQALNEPRVGSMLSAICPILVDSVDAVNHTLSPTAFI